jgi:3-(methylthio)propanoyl-CoA dehydrogenase
MYRAPLRDIRFVIHELLGDAALEARFKDVDYSGELGDSVLEEAAKFAETVLAPTNRPGDSEGAAWTPEGVRTPAGFREAYAEYIAGGWPQLGVPTALGGQGMPQVVGSAVEEMMFASNMAFFLGTSLARGAVEAIVASGGAEHLPEVVEKLVSGEWMGTMNLTEPQAGSDLGLLRTRAAPDGDRWRIFGQKIFITYGDHDMTENIAHLVLARIDGAPAGVKGISMFYVPKRLPDGNLNDLRCLSIEHKMGLHGSPTCVMAFGEKEGAIGWLLGAPNSGLSHMFIMMNAARLSVGVQGLAQSERALQQALEWARSRKQGRPADGSEPGPVPLVQHPDVKRMLLSMKSRTEAMRALAYTAGLALDIAHHDADAQKRQAAMLRAELLTPIVKAWCTEVAIEVTSLGIQVHGGMGYIEETGASQFLRDVRVASIYEGTTGIQANDLVGRKLGRDRGGAMAALLKELLEGLNDVRATDVPTKVAKNAAIEALVTLRDTTDWLLQLHGESPARALAVSVPYLMLCGTVLGGALLARSAGLAGAALAAATGDADFYRAKQQTARFYAEQVLPAALGLARVVKAGSSAVAEADPALL